MTLFIPSAENYYDLKFCDNVNALLVARDCISLGSIWHRENCEYPDCSFNVPDIKNCLKNGGRNKTTLKIWIEMSIPYNVIKTAFPYEKLHIRRQTCQSSDHSIDTGQFCNCNNV